MDILWQSIVVLCAIYVAPSIAIDPIADVNSCSFVRFCAPNTVEASAAPIPKPPQTNLDFLPFALYAKENNSSDIPKPAVTLPMFKYVPKPAGDGANAVGLAGKTLDVKNRENSEIKSNFFIISYSFYIIIFYMLYTMPYNACVLFDKAL